MSKGNEPAFASVWKPSEKEAHWGHKEVMHSGLTKREYFAGLAMQGLLSRVDMSSDERARYAIENADDLLAELEKTA